MPESIGKIRTYHRSSDPICDPLGDSKCLKDGANSILELETYDCPPAKLRTIKEFWQSRVSNDLIENVSDKL